MLIALVVVWLAGCSSSSPSSGVPELTDEYGCGYGFYVGAADQSAGLFLDYNDFEAAANGHVADSALLPGDEWTAGLQMGRDLFSNWCDDVIEPHEPEPLVEEDWQVSGRIDIRQLPPAGQCGVATASLLGLTARSDDGVEISLGDLEIQNELWGCFAG